MKRHCIQLIIHSEDIPICIIQDGACFKYSPLFQRGKHDPAEYEQHEQAKNTTAPDPSYQKPTEMV